MNDNSLKDEIIVKLEQALKGLKQLETDGDLEKFIQAGQLLTIDEAADICRCSCERIRRLCEKSAATPHPIALKKRKVWLIVAKRLLDQIEREKGKHTRLVAESDLAKRRNGHFQ